MWQSVQWHARESWVYLTTKLSQMNSLKMMLGRSVGWCTLWYITESYIFWETEGSEVAVVQTYNIYSVVTALSCYSISMQWAHTAL